MYKPPVMKRDICIISGFLNEITAVIYTPTTLYLCWITESDREKRDIRCPGVSEAIIIQPSGSLSGSFLIFNKQV